MSAASQPATASTSSAAAAYNPDAPGTAAVALVGQPASHGSGIAPIDVRQHEVFQQHAAA